MQSLASATFANHLGRWLHDAATLQFMLLATATDRSGSFQPAGGGKAAVQS